ncbi:MAG TPA: hypothetical protein VKX25_14925 [Bryobacteraceae bacterium]|jgi:hypothetical protein|nr:hypothetical protein [Bryobacteraceae bacterium]
MALVQWILEGPGHALATERGAAFANAGLAGPLASLVDKVAKCSYKITDEDIAGAKAAGRSEDQLFELIVCAATGQAARQYDTALAALDAAADQE